MKRLILIIPLLVLVSGDPKAQTKSYIDKCEVIEAFLNSPKVDSNFSRYGMNAVDSYIIVDMRNSLLKCNLKTWRGKQVSVLNNGPLFDSVSRYRWPYLVYTKGQLNLYRFIAREVNKKAGIIYLQGYGSIICEAKYFIKNKRYYLGNITVSVE